MSPLGCYEISLGDTIGIGTPEKARNMLAAIQNVPRDKIAAHFHDTYDRAIENLLVALEVITFISSLKTFLCCNVEWSQRD